MGADPNLRADNGYTALTFAATQGDVAVTRALLAAGADANAPGGLGGTPLFSATWKRNSQLIRVLKGGSEDRATSDTGAPGSLPAERLRP